MTTPTISDPRTGGTNNMKHNRESNILQRVMSAQFYEAMEKSDGYLAGGVIRSVFSSEPINDFDIFFRSKTDFDACVEALGIDDSPSFTTTDTAWTHIDAKKDHYQLICAEFGEPVDVIKKFDFTCCMGAWVKNEFVLDELFLKHCSQRRLIFNANAQFPICSLWRAAKFIKRGWKLPGIEAIKISLSINHLDLKSRGELKRQLMGIDTLFLKELTDALQNNAATAYDFAEAIDMIMAFGEKEEE